MLFPGDPTDTSIKLRPLEPASGQALARDLVLKTRRRKGLGDQIAVSKYLDDEFVVSGLVWYLGWTVNDIGWPVACVVCVGACGPARVETLIVDSMLCCCIYKLCCNDFSEHACQSVGNVECARRLRGRLSRARFR